MIVNTKNKISYFLRRHPVFFYARYFFIAKNFKGTNLDAVGCYNDINKLQDVPPIFHEVNAKINLSITAPDFEKALQIASYLRTNFKGGTALSLSSGKTLEKMIAEEGGICGDFSQIFSVFCFINNIRVKEWHCVDRFYKTQFGHTFNEIYSSELSKWIAIDSHKSVYFTTEEDTMPLSSVELFSHVRKDQKLKFISFSAYQLKKIERLPLVFSKKSIPFIIGNYINKDIDYYLDKYDNKYPPFLVNFYLLVLKKNYTFIFVMDNYKKLLFPVFYRS